MEDHPEDIDSNEGNGAKRELIPSSSARFVDVLKSDTFIDKTALILAVLRDPNCVLLCTAPRRFGKTVNLTMMQSFLELEVNENGKEKTTVLEEKGNYKLFSSRKLQLKVMKNKKFVETHFGKYPIINVNFLCQCDIKSRSDAVVVCRDAIHWAFKEHEYLYESKESPLKDEEKRICERWCGDLSYEEITDEYKVVTGLGFLAKYLKKFHKRKIFMLVDEYDSIISNALYNVKNVDPQKELEELECASSFCIRVIGSVLKKEVHIIQGGFITGILDVAGITISSLLGNVRRKQFGTKNLCQDFYGFNEAEVCTLFDRWGVNEQLKKKAIAKYNGYVNTKMKPLYNPQSIVQFLENVHLGEGALQNYWQQSGYVLHLYEIFRKDSFRSLLNKLLQGAVNFETNITPLELSDLKSLHNLLIHSNLICTQEIVVKFLISLGYLTYSVDDNTLKIPNGELIDEFNRRLQYYFSERYGIKNESAQACSRSFSALARLCDEDDSYAEFKEELTNFERNVSSLLKTATLIDPLNEATLQAVVSTICTRGGFLFGNEIIIPNYGTKIDVVLYNDTFGSIVEMKCNAGSSKDALEQIFANHYCNVFTMKKYFNDLQKSPSLSLVMGMHVDSKKEASALCLRKRDIIDVLDNLKIEAMQSLETRIEIAVNSGGETAINTFLKKAIGTL